MLVKWNLAKFRGWKHITKYSLSRVCYLLWSRYFKTVQALFLSCKTEVFSYCTSYWKFHEKTESDAHHHHPSLPLCPPWTEVVQDVLRKVSALLLELLITEAMTVLYKIITSHTSISYHRFVWLQWKTPYTPLHWSWSFTHL